MKGLQVNDYFRKLENATHSNWSADRVQNVAEAAQKIKDLRAFVINSINKLMTGAILEEVSATGVGETLPDEDEITNDDHENNKNESIEDEVFKSIEITEKKPKKVTNEETTSDEESEEIGLQLDETGKIIDTAPVHKEPTPPSPGPNPNPSDPQLHYYSEVNKKLLPKKLRLMQSEQGYKLKLSLNNNEEIIRVDVEIYGESGNEKAPISKAKCSMVTKFVQIGVPVEIIDNHLIIKKLSKENDYELEFSIESDEIWPLEVRVYGKE